LLSPGKKKCFFPPQEKERGRKIGNQGEGTRRGGLYLGGSIFKKGP